MVAASTDKTPQKPRKARAFVMVDRVARERLRERLWTLRGTTRAPDGTLREVGVDVAYSTAMWALDLLSEAQWDTGELPLTDKALASRYAISRNTVKARVDLLTLAGVLEGGAGARRFAPAALAWLTKGDPPPLDGVIAGLRRFNAEASAGASEPVETPVEVSTTEHGVSVEVSTTEHGVSTTEHESVNHRARSEPVDKAGSPINTGPQGPEMINDGCLDVKDVDQPPDQAVVGDLLDRLDKRLPGCLASPGLKAECQRLTQLGWTLDEIEQRLATAANAQNPGLFVTVLRSVKGPPPGVAGAQQAAERKASSDAKEQAPDCQHGEPHGTWDGGGSHGPNWRQCPICKKQLQREVDRAA